MEDYKKAVQYMASEQVDTEFGNKGNQHAAIVLSNMLKYSKESFKIFSGSFNKDVTNDQEFIGELQSFLESGKTFQLYLEKYPQDNEIIGALKLVFDAQTKNPEAVQVKEATQTFKDDLSRIFREGKPYHFAIADSKAFRIEIDAKEYKATCNFNDPRTAEKLTNIFNDHFGL